MEEMIKDIIVEMMKSINEQDEKETNELPDSLDAQIDALMIKYDTVASNSADQGDLSESTIPTSLSFLLEQLDEPEAAPGPDQVLDVEDEAKDEDSDTEKDLPETQPKLDVQMFTERVARLASMPDRILDIATVILVRAEQYVRENYDDATASEMKEMLYTEHRLELPEDALERVVDTDVPPPAASGAGPGGSGG
tara:strand:- start:25194 stop:25778 length:585 start_codon:yes stop_codon:yes gene_type:complete